MNTTHLGGTFYQRGHPDSLDPYKTLDIEKNASYCEVKDAFFRLSTQNKRNIRCKACLAYDMIVNPHKYTIQDEIYKVKTKDCFYDVLVGDLDSLKEKVSKDKNLIFQKDELKRSLLYLAARNGYFDMTKYLIEKGADLNEIQKDGSTPLHGAAYYGQYIIVQLLLEYGAKPNIKNNFGNLAIEEARTDDIKNNILHSEKDRINILFQNLLKEHLATNLIPISKKNKVIAYKILCNTDVNKSWIPVWHGTKYKFLESIVKNGLRPSGTKLKDGTVIKPPSNHISLNETFEGIKNWAKAIFVSPSIFYAADACYSERINIKNRRWSVLIEAKVKPKCYTKHNSSCFRSCTIEDEPEDVEYRVEVDESDDLIYRCTTEKYVKVVSVVFVSTKFLEDIEEYEEGKIVVNSKEERELLS